jgi:hypothetical protein
VIKSVVFGGLDGIITTFSIVAAVAGASLSVEVVLLMGFANLIADGISMGLGDALSEVRTPRRRAPPCRLPPASPHPQCFSPPTTTPTATPRAGRGDHVHQG